ncbi:MAG: hypothetical protein RL226_1814 [Bacteroidota bacterium]|jgi:hypothetical protein
MKNVGSLLGGVLLAVVSWAQTAPNFTVTDIDGTQHNLYADYLDQGKSVILGMFYIGSPWFNEVSLLLEYSLDTASSQNVDLLYLSYVDSNSELATYAELSGLTRPMIGSQGGSGSAMAPYTLGSGFGIFYGYPLYVVVHPDKSVTYDPAGSTPEEMAQAILLAANGVVSVSSVYETPVLVHTSGSTLYTHNCTGEWLTLFDLSGKRVFESLAQPAHELALPSGMYIFHLSNGSNSRSGKVYLDAN